MMAAATSAARMTPQKEGFWLAQLEHLDGAMATEAVLSGIKGWTRFPSWAEFGEAYQSVSRRALSEQERAERDAADDAAGPIRARRMPFWVKRWVAARWLTGGEPDMRRFAEQGDWADINLAVMPDGEWNEVAEKITDAQAFTVLLGAEL